MRKQQITPENDTETVFDPNKRHNLLSDIGDGPSNLRQVSSLDEVKEAATKAASRWE